MSKQYLKKRAVAARYGNITTRTVDRLVDRGVLPPPEYPFGTRVPYWDAAVLDANDRAAALAARPKCSARRAEIQATTT